MLHMLFLVFLLVGPLTVIVPDFPHQSSLQFSWSPLTLPSLPQADLA